tara:strand:+ start:685 stop:1053 length:369 start_codon:yes stop_codon:yes gene_type:complete
MKTLITHKKEGIMDSIKVKHDIPEAIQNRRFSLNVCRLMYAWSFGKDIPNDMSFGDALRDVWNSLNKDGVGDYCNEWVSTSPAEVYLNWADCGEGIVKEGRQAFEDEMELAFDQARIAREAK